MVGAVEVRKRDSKESGAKTPLWQHDDTTGSSNDVGLSRLVSPAFARQTLVANAFLSLGYNCSPSSLDLATTTALKVTRSRKAERRARKVTRNVFLCYVLGAAGSGKTSLLKSFVQGGRRDRREEAYEPTSKVVSVVNSVEVGGGEKYLVVSTQLEYEVSEADGDGQLQEFGSKYESETLRNPRRLEAADVIIYVFDSSDPNSFSYVSNLRQQYALDDVPSIFVATKSDLDLAQQVRRRRARKRDGKNGWLIVFAPFLRRLRRSSTLLLFRRNHLLGRKTHTIDY